MLARNEPIAFIATADAKRAKRFYGEMLGLPIVHEDDFALVCDANGTMLRIQKVESFQPQGFTALGWQVPNIAETVDGLGSRGLRFERFPGMDQDAQGIWKAPSGALVAWFKDPDGNVLSLTQF